MRLGRIERGSAGDKAKKKGVLKRQTMKGGGLGEPGAGGKKGKEREGG